jgi:RHS repeat-associated protein
MELQIGSQEPLYQIMLARYYASSLGRFMAVDPVGGTASNPQSWNRYSCVRNNPLRYTDPTGTSPHGKGSGTMTMLQCSNGKCAQKQVPLPSGMPMHIAHDFKSDKKGEEG